MSDQRQAFIKQTLNEVIISSDDDAGFGPDSDVIGIRGDNLSALAIAFSEEAELYRQGIVDSRRHRREQMDTEVLAAPIVNRYEEVVAEDEREPQGGIQMSLEEKRALLNEDGTPKRDAKGDISIGAMFAWADEQERQDYHEERRRAYEKKCEARKTRVTFRNETDGRAGAVMPGSPVPRGPSGPGAAGSSSSRGQDDSAEKKGS